MLGPFPGGGGDAVSVSGDIAAVSSGESSTSIFEKIAGDWVESATIPRGVNYHGGIAISGDIFVVSGYGPDWTPTNGLGEHAIIIYERLNGSWVEAAKFSTPYFQGNPVFGASVAVEGGIVVASAEAEFFFVYGKSKGLWSLTATLNADNQDNPGKRSVAIYGDTIVVSPGFNFAAVFERVNSSWERSSTLGGDEIVGGVATYGDGIAVLSYKDASDPGYVRIYRKELDRFQPTNSVRPSDGGDLHSVSIADGTLFNAPDGIIVAGKYVFYQTTGGIWNDIVLMPPGGSAVGDKFGACGSISGCTIFIGAPGIDSAYILPVPSIRKYI